MLISVSSVSFTSGGIYVKFIINILVLFLFCFELIVSFYYNDVISCKIV